MSAQHTPGPTIRQMRARMNSGHRAWLEALRDGRKVATTRAGDARGLMTCRATLIGWGAITDDGLTTIGQALLDNGCPLGSRSDAGSPGCTEAEMTRCRYASECDSAAIAKATGSQS